MYEVTGHRLQDSEFRGDETSSSEEAEGVEDQPEAKLLESKGKKPVKKRRRGSIDMERYNKIMSSLLDSDNSDENAYAVEGSKET